MSGFFGKLKKLQTVTCTDVVDAYGAFLETTPYGAGLALPMSELPYDISLIKEALTKLATLPEHHEKVAMLKNGFLELAAFSGGEFKSSGMMSGLSLRPTTGEQLAAFFAENGGRLSETEEISAKIAAKREVLEGEWELRLNVQKVSGAERFSA